jgi:hypothetical protein
MRVIKHKNTLRVIQQSLRGCLKSQRDLSYYAARLYNRELSKSVVTCELCQPKTIYLKNREKGY